MILDSSTILLDDVATIRAHRFLTSLNVAAATFLLYETIITMGDEVECFWKSARWGFVKILYLLIRYLGLALICFSLATNFFVTTVAVCDNYFIVIGIGIWIIPLFSDIVMALRVYTLWGRTRKILIFLIVFLVVNTGLALLLFIIGNNLAPPRQQGIIMGCFATEFPKLSNAALIPNLLNAFVLFALTAYKVKQITGRRNGALGAPNEAPLLRTLLEHSVIYFLAIWALLVTDTIILYVVTGPYATIIFGPSMSILTWLSSRLLIHLRRGYLVNPTPPHTSRSRTAASSSARTPAAVGNYSAGAIMTTIMSGPWNIDELPTILTFDDSGGGDGGDVELDTMAVVEEGTGNPIQEVG